MVSCGVLCICESGVVEAIEKSISKMQYLWADLLEFNLICNTSLGPNHPKTIRAKETLEEPMYKRLKEQRERQAAGTA